MSTHGDQGLQERMCTAQGPILACISRQAPTCMLTARTHRSAGRHANPGVMQHGRRAPSTTHGCVLHACTGHAPVRALAAGDVEALEQLRVGQQRAGAGRRELQHIR